ncbi:MAG: HAMP domain-containing sensor histidine kinase [Actinomycetota bacterium]|nr:HAMP domain-containing sensor histidine kinase [Actinomycetota bacterium]
MTRRLVLAMTSLVALVALALAIPLAIVVATDQRAAFIAQLEVETLAAASLLSSEDSSAWPATTQDVAARTGARVVVVDPDRVLMADSDASALDRSFDRPELDQALAGRLASDVRPSATLGEELRFVAAPVVQDSGVVAAVRLSLPEAAVEEAVESTARWLIVFVVCVVLAAGLVAWLVARSIVAPLRRLADVAAELPVDLSRRADEASGPPEVRAVARALNSTAERLSGILQRTQRVAADASHHLRTPLTGVRLRLEAIEDTAQDAALRAEAQAATAEVDRLSHRIDQVLALARSDAGQSPLEVQDAAAVVQARVDAAGPMFDERGIALSVDAVGPARVLAPAGVVARIVDELMGNAMAYARTRVDVELHRAGPMVVLTVSDDGPGVAASELDRVFERFTRATTAVPGGSGLGLALVRESVRAIGGEAVAGRSSLGGLSVTVQVPGAAG